ncbi:hypothetical protein DNTS_015296 [Danionella cerebrum]|uniref:Uncharacterized protein n=1 Tax=Danionella cerebrum TaxID=2873325 RepID=A0A553QHH0_9TELE|nr:hypothetical protein DNTS_015296 [Danionella translucida]
MAVHRKSFLYTFSICLLAVLFPGAPCTPPKSSWLFNGDKLHQIQGFEVKNEEKGHQSRLAGRGPAAQRGANTADNGVGLCQALRGRAAPEPLIRNSTACLSSTWLNGRGGWMGLEILH